MAQILIIEDEAVIRGSLKRLLERNGHQAAEAGSVHEAEAQFALADFDLLIADLRLPGEPGTAAIDKAGGTPVLIMTSYASIRSAVEAMRLGAADYIAKPFDHDEMLLTVDRLLEQRRLRRQNDRLKSELSRCYPVGGMIGDCPAMREVFGRIERVAPTDTTVLILGESGTGKELVARALHERSGRDPASFITVNCAAIPEGLIESELFGHEKGAFTGAAESRSGLFEAAEGGTLFLDEIGELPLEVQARLLRVLQDGEIRRVGATRARKVDARLVAATHRDLARAVGEGNFREDLWFRLNVVEIELPPLRERGDDLLELARVLLERQARRLNRPPLTLSDAALQALRDYHWPGNVRELENVIERAVILSDGPIIDADALAVSRPAAAEPPTASLDDYFVQFVRRHEAHMSETELARELGISRKTLWAKRQRFNLPRRRGD